MELTLADERLFLLEERLGRDDIRNRALLERASAVAGGIGGLLQRPKAEEIELVAMQRRVEPFWHVSGHARPPPARLNRRAATGGRPYR